jgi:23S rRNA A1618 N6-methylase RlmF
VLVFDDVKLMEIMYSVLSWDCPNHLLTPMIDMYIRQDYI